MISVIVPIYNVEQYMRRCVDSLLQQKTEQEYEIILVDDGSTDRSGKLCDDYQVKHPEKIKVIHKTNGGLGSARNEGVNNASGEWICFVDSDDYVESTYLEVLYGLVKRFDADMSVISIKKTLEGHELVSWKKRCDDFVLDKKNAFYEIYAKHMFTWCGPCKLYNKKVFSEHCFPNGTYEDFASQYLFIDSCEKVAFGDYRAEYHYLFREGSITSQSFSDSNLRIFEICDEVRDYIMNKYPEWEYVSVQLYQKAETELLNRVSMSWKQYNALFKKYRKLFRKNVWRILSVSDFNFPTKYYAVVFCTTPILYKMQRKVVTKLLDKV